jgi:hypothetical protein
MIARSALLVVAGASIGCGAPDRAEVTLTDLVVTPASNGAITSGTFNLNVARSADASGSGPILLHTLEIDSDDYGSADQPFTVSRLVGDASADVGPGAEAVFPLRFELDHAGAVDAAPFVACTGTMGGFYLKGIYFDEAEGGFFPIRSEPSWIPSKTLSGTTWARTFGDSTEQIAYDAAVFPDGTSIVVGSTAGTADFKEKPGALEAIPTPFLMKLDADGAPLWSRLAPMHAVDTLTAPRQGPSLVAAAPDGGIVVAGVFDGTLDLGTGAITSAGETDVFLARLDANGKALETRRFGDGLKQLVAAMNVDAAGDVVLVGTLGGAMDFGAGPIAPLIDPSATSYYVAKLAPSGAPVYARVPLVLAKPGHFSAAVGLDGTVILGGSFTSEAWIGAEPPHAASIESGFLVELAADGSIAWSAVIDGAVVTQIGVDQGDIVATVSVTGTASLGGKPVSGGPNGTLFLARFDPAGALRYTVPLGGAGAVAVASLEIDSAGHALLAGSRSGPLQLPGSTFGPAEEQSSFLAELDRSGAHVRSTAFGCANAPVEVAVARTGSRDVVLVSTFAGAVDVGKGRLPSAGGTDVLVAKLPAP